MGKHPEGKETDNCHQEAFPSKGILFKRGDAPWIMKSGVANLNSFEACLMGRLGSISMPNKKPVAMFML